MANALGSSVEAAQKSLDKGNTKSAIDQLNALLNKIKAQRGKMIPEGGADALTDDIQDLIDQLP